MNYKITIFVFILAVVLVTIALIKMNSQPLGQKNNPLDKLSEAQNGVRLLDPADFNPDKVKRIELNYASDTNTYIFERDLGVSQSSDQGGWKQIKPLPYSMDNWALNMLPSSASGIMVFQEIPQEDFSEDMTLATLGLEPPQATVVFVTDSRTISVYLSGESMAGKTFLQLDKAGPVYVVDNVLHNNILGKNPRDWRNKTIFENTSTDISRINIVDNVTGKPVTLWNIDGKWNMIEPVNTQVDQQSAGQLVSGIISARLQGFAEDKPTDLNIYGLTDPDLRVSIELSKPEADGSVSVDHQVLLVGGRIGLTDDIWYAKRTDRDDIFTIGASTLNKLKPDAQSLVSKCVLDTSADNIKSLVISTENPEGTRSSIKLTRTIDGWSVRDINDNLSEDSPADVRAVNDLLSCLTTAHETVEITDDKADAQVRYSTIARIEVEGFSGMIGNEVQIVVDSDLDPAQQKIKFRDSVNGINRFSSIQTLPPLTIAALSATAGMPSDNEPAYIDTEPTK